MTSRNIFHEKSYTKCGGEASPRPFYKKTNFECNSSEILQSLFLLYVQVEVYKVIKIKVLTTCFYLI